MLFETENTYVRLAGPSDINQIVQIYNSNPGFLLTHLDRDVIDAQWLEQEMKSMEEIGFRTGIVELKTGGTAIGILDFSTHEVSYLALLMMHFHSRRSGLGSEVYIGFERFAREHKSDRIRIDVVYPYDESVLDFWVRKGFEIIGQVEMNWGGKFLTATKMEKSI